jgi:hypothetical protein
LGTQNDRASHFSVFSKISNIDKVKYTKNSPQDLKVHKIKYTAQRKLLGTEINATIICRSRYLQKYM